MIEIEEKQIGWSWRKRTTLVGVCVACFMLPLDMSVVGVALESIGRDLGATFAALQWVINAYNVVFGSLLLTAGALADLFGRRRMFTTGVVIFTTASLLCGFSQGPLMLNVFRAVQGFGAAFVLTSGTAVLANEFRSPPERAKAFGLLGSCFGTGLALGPLIGGAFSSGLGWRWIFLVNVPIGLAVLALAAPKMSESSDPAAQRVDLAGLVTFSISLLLLISGLISGPEKGWGSFQIVGMLLGALVLLVLFIGAELIQKRPMFDLGLFRKSSFIAAQLLPLVVAFSFVAMLIYIPLYFQGVRGYSAFQAGLTMLPLTVPVFIMPAIGGSLAARLPLRVLLGVGLVLMSVGAFWASRFEGGASWTALLGGLLLTGIGAGLTSGLMDNLAVSVAPVERSGMAAGIFNTMRIVGEAIAIAGAGAILLSLNKSRFLDLISGTSAVGDQITELANRVARGDLSGATAAVPPAGREAFLQVVTQSYSEALSLLLVIVACISFAGAVLILLLVQARDIVKEPAH